METGKELFEKALKLNPQERFALIDGLIQSLDEPNQEMNDIWTEEATKRLTAYRDGKLKGIPYEAVFGDD
jgi:putative addiction module component (TIGR02574 family)